VPTEPGFEKLLARLPAHIREIARHAIENPRAPQYHLAKLDVPRKSSFRKRSWRIWVTRDYRAVAEPLGDGGFSWYWVGTKPEYAKKLSRK